MLDERLAAPFTADANDFLYQWESSGDYDPSPGAATHHGHVLAINCRRRRAQSAGDRPDRARDQAVKNGRLYLIPASEETRGHGTTGMARFYAQPLAELLQRAPPAVR